MNTLVKTVVIPLALSGFASDLLAQNQTRDGALMGGVAGALLGGVIGHQNKETTEGALIGGAVGALAGGVIGNQQQKIERERYYNSMHSRPVYVEQHTHTFVPAAPTHVVTRQVVPRRAVTTSEVINMTRSGVSDAVIVAHIQSNGIAMRPDVNDVILMNQEGVSDYVITMMQQTGTGYRAPTPVYRTYQQPAVVVQEQYYAPPQPVYTGQRTYYVERRGF
jgi:hypothetical protein